MVEAAPQARPEDHLGGIFRFSFVAEYHLGLTSALQHCQHNGAFRFLAAQVSVDLGGISGPPFRSFRPTLEQQIVFFGMRACRSRFLMVLGLNLDVWGSRIKHLVWKGLQKPASHICRDYVDFGIIFTWFSMASGPIVMTFGGSGAGLKFYDFRWFFGGSRS